jgi:hypothetical protein
MQGFELVATVQIRLPELEFPVVDVELLIK